MNSLALQENISPQIFYIMYRWLAKTQSLKNMSYSSKDGYLNQVDPMEKWEEDSGTQNRLQYSAALVQRIISRSTRPHLPDAQHRIHLEFPQFWGHPLHLHHISPTQGNILECKKV